MPNTDWGRCFIVDTVTSASGGAVTIAGISGRFPDALRVARITLGDEKGVWLTIDDAALDWSPSRLLARELRIDSLTASHVTVARMPGATGGSSSGTTSLPVHIMLNSLKITRLDLAEPQASLAVEGHAALVSLQEGNGGATLRRLGGDGLYQAEGRLDAAGIALHATLAEPAQGLVATLAGLPDLGAIDARLDATGPWNAAVAKLAVSAGGLRLAANGNVDIVGQSGELDLTASAPAMTPRPDLGWKSVDVQAHLSGPVAKLQAKGTLLVQGLTAGGMALDRANAAISGDLGAISAKATLDGLHLPGPQPDLFAADPMTVQADIRLDLPDRPVNFVISHKYLVAEGNAHTARPLSAALKVTLPDLSKAGNGVGGMAQILSKMSQIDNSVMLDINGHIALTAAPTPLPALLGPDAQLGVTAKITGEDVLLTRLHLDGRTGTFDAHGQYVGGVMALDSVLSLTDLAALAPALQGAISVASHIGGKPDGFTAHADVTGTLGTKGFPAAPVRVALNASGLPGAPMGDFTADATLDGAPLRMAATMDRAADGTMHLNIARSDWKTAHAEGALSLPPGADLPQGHLEFAMANLGELRRLTGQSLAGSVTATLDMDDKARAKLVVDAKGVAPLDRLQIQADGPQNALAIRVSASGAGESGTAAANLDVPGQMVTLTALQAGFQGETLRLLGPARVNFADGVRVDQLRLGLREAVLQIGGRVSPGLDVTASLRNLPAGLARLFAPDLRAEGTLSADAKLTGDPASPSGTVRVEASGLHLRDGPGSAFAPARVQARADLNGKGTAQIDARASLGGNTLTVIGTAPLEATGKMALRLQGGVDLAVLDPLLTPHGQRARGKIALDGAVAGTPSAPAASGTVRLTGGSFEDLSQGFRLSAIDALLRGNGDEIRIERLTAKAGGGSVSASGRVGLAAPMPLDVTLTARNASPLATDNLSVVLDADLVLQGAVQTGMAASGTVKIASADIRIPERLPADVAVLNVRRPGDAPEVPAAAGPDVALDLTISAPGRILIHGRGVDAELQGQMKIGGTAAAPRTIGQLKLRRGQFNLVGKALAFTTGEVGLDGSGRMDPTLHFVASNTSNSVTSTLTITGYASAPKIALSAVPELPQDEVLARLLFGTSVSSLGPLQLGQIAAGLAQLSGAGGGFDPLEKLRSGLGLDRLNVGGDGSGRGASVEAGRTVAQGVYVGARQGTAGTGTQAVVQIDLARGLKLETTVGTASQGTAQSATGAAGSSGGSSVGLTYEFQY